jgi:hypothetical protein
MIDGGVIWSGVRAGLMYERESIEKAFAQKSHERESADLDAIARRITARVQRCIEVSESRSEVTSKEQKNG